MKISNLNQSKNILKDISLVFEDLLTKILVFNPKKRLTIEEILKH